MSQVVGSTQSPLNPRKWIVDLSCGHAVWITSARKPRRNVQCVECWMERQPKAATREERGKK